MLMTRMTPNVIARPSGEIRIELRLMLWKAGPQVFGKDSAKNMSTKCMIIENRASN